MRVALLCSGVDHPNCSAHAGEADWLIIAADSEASASKLLGEAIRGGWWRSRITVLTGEVEGRIAGLPVAELIDAYSSALESAEAREPRVAGAEVRGKPLPLHDYEACKALVACSRCVEECPYNALQGKPPTVDATRCASCGHCASTCAAMLVDPPGLPLDALSSLIEWAARRGLRGVAVYCQRQARLASRWGPGLLPIRLPCIQWLNPLAALGAAVALPIVIAAVECSSCGLSAAVAEYMSALEELKQLYPRLHVEVRSRVTPPPLPSRRGEPVPLRRFSILRAAAPHAEPPASEGKLENLKVFWRIRHDANLCSRCGTCAARCPTQALVYEETRSGARLMYRQAYCVGCSLCAATCPEGAITSVEPGYVAASLRSPDSHIEVLAEDEIARCPACGKPVAPRRMIEAMKARLLAAGFKEEELEYLYYCEDCRIVVRMGFDPKKVKVRRLPLNESEDSSSS